jgi:superfamily II DNA or RNA helicase
MLDSKPTEITSGLASSSSTSSVPTPSIPAAISSLKFPFSLTKDQLEAVDAWVLNGYKGLLIYSTGTGKTEIAFECAKRAAEELIKLHSIARPNATNKCSTDFQNGSANASNSFNILFLVPRIILIEQNIKRLERYNVPKEKVGVFFGERKEAREITISTYQSIINNVDLVYNSRMLIFDEIHLVSDTAMTLRKIFEVIVSADHKKLLLGLTATIDEEDPKYNTILSLLPPVKKYMIKDAVRDKRLAKPVVIPTKVHLTHHEKKIYSECSSKIKNISEYLGTSDPKSIISILKKGGHTAGLARSWFANVKMRKDLVNCAENKLISAVNLIKDRHPNERIMVFSETIESIEKLKKLLQNQGIASMIIDSKLKSKERQKILSEWGKEFFPLLSVHTLEIGYDMPEVRIAIILATSSNMNQITQRIGRTLRKTKGKDTALIYAIYLSDTRDASTLKMVRQATNMNKQGLQAYETRNIGQMSDPCKDDSLDKYVFRC